MIFKILAVMIATLSGSVHCGAMCGGLSVSIGSRIRDQVWYQSTRLFSYLLVGALAGRSGGVLFNPEVSSELAMVGGAILSGILIYSGIHLYFKGQPPEWGSFFSGWVFGRLGRPLRKASQGSRAALTGLLTPLLPCAWLFTAGVLAFRSGSVVGGVLVFFAVWAGSLPILVLGSTLSQAFQRRVGVRARKGVATLMVLAGLFSVYEKLSVMRVEGAVDSHILICK